MTEHSSTAAAVLAIAESWIGTPYRHQASLKGVGADCLGLVRGIWRELYGTEPERPGPYGMDWTDSEDSERLSRAACTHFGPPLARADMAPGDLLLFAWREGLAPRHLGILATGGRFIHAWERGAVIASPLYAGWARRISAIHRFPEI